jgi:hypothetical protein
MNNTFAKVSNSIVSRALSRFGSKPAASIGSKAKAAIGLGGLAGAGALAHHYDVLAPSRFTSQIANEVAAPASIPVPVKQVTKEIAPTTLSRSIPIDNIPSAGLEEAAIRIPKPNTSTTSNARKVLQEISKDPENVSANKPSESASPEMTQEAAEELEILETQRKTQERLRMLEEKARERVRMREETELMEFLTGGDTPLVSNFYEPGSIQASRELLHDARHSVLGHSDQFVEQHGMGATIDRMKKVEHRTLDQLITARDVASHTGKKHLVPAINKKIDSTLDLLNSQKARDHSTRAWVLDPVWNLSPFNTRGYSNPNAFLAQWLNYDLNPWGASKATDIPIDLEKGRFIEAARRKGRYLAHYRDDYASLEDLVSGVDYDSAITKAESNSSSKAYIDKVVKFLEELRDSDKSPRGYTRKSITKILENEERPLIESLFTSDNVNPAFPLEAHGFNPGQFIDTGTVYLRAAPHQMTDRGTIERIRDDIDKARGTGKLLLRPGIQAFNDSLSPIIDLDDETLIKLHRPKR